MGFAFWCPLSRPFLSPRVAPLSCLSLRPPLLMENCSTFQPFAIRDERRPQGTLTGRAAASLWPKGTPANNRKLKSADSPTPTRDELTRADSRPRVDQNVAKEISLNFPPLAQKAEASADDDKASPSRRRRLVVTLLLLVLCRCRFRSLSLCRLRSPWRSLVLSTWDPSAASNTTNFARVGTFWRHTSCVIETCFDGSNALTT